MRMQYWKSISGDVRENLMINESGEVFLIERCCNFKLMWKICPAALNPEEHYCQRIFANFIPWEANAILWAYKFGFWDP